MRRAGLKSLMILVLGALCLYGCSGSDGPLDEMGQRYTGFLEVEDNGEATLQVDTTQDICSATENDDGTFTVELEEFSDALGQVIISVSNDAPGITLKSYTIEYIPLESTSGNGIVMPPTLDNPGTGYATFDIPSGGEGTLFITLISVDTKDEFVLNVDGGLQVARYTVRLQLNFEDTYGNDRKITVDRTVYLSNYDNC